MTDTAGAMHLWIPRIDEWWRVTMTGVARSSTANPGRAGGCHDSCMIRSWRMRDLPRIRMTLRTVACRCCRNVGGRVMAGCTAVVLLVVCCIYKVSVINRLGMTAATFTLQRYLSRMVLRRMRRKVGSHSTVAL
jgi:hypothetical protein